MGMPHLCHHIKDQHVTEMTKQYNGGLFAIYD